MTTQEQEQLERDLKLQADLFAKAKKIASNPLVQFAAGWIGMDIWLRRR